MTTTYVLELCDTADAHRPIAHIESASPFIAVNVGDRFDDTGWERLDGIGVIHSAENPKRYTVHSIKHLLVESKEQVLVKYCLNLQPYSGPASPVWDDSQQ